MIEECIPITYCWKFHNKFMAEAFTFSNETVLLNQIDRYPTRRRGIEYNHGRTKFACYRSCLDSQQRLLFPCEYQNSKSQFGWMTYTYFKDDYRKKGPAVPGSSIYKRLKRLRTGIERYYGLTKENRYHMEVNNTYMGHDNVLIHVIEHDIVATLDIIYEHAKTGKWSDVLNV